MQIAVVGLGRMGGNIVRRLANAGHNCVVFDRQAAAVAALTQDSGVAGARSLDDLVARLAPPRAVWLMLPAGTVTEETVAALAERLSAGDVIIDGGNSFWQDDLRRARSLAGKSLHYVDVGTSGGIWGLERGFCLMIGGENQVVARLEPIFAALAPGREGAASSPGRSTAESGYLHVGGNGAGHFVKMVHNGIEYGLMQAYAEGFDILKNADAEALPKAERFELDIAGIAELWRHGSIVSSRLLDVIAKALDQDSRLRDFSGVVDDTGEGRWTVQTAIERAIPAMALTTALNARFRSRRESNFADKMISAMRRGFGGHAEIKGKR